MNLARKLISGTAMVGMLAAVAWAQAPAPNTPPPPQTPPSAARLYQVRGGFLGIGIQEVTPERMKALKLKEEAGVEITRVGPDSPAEKGGLKVGDVILQYNGIRVDGIEQFSRLVRETPIGRDSKMEVFRNGASQTLMVKIGQHPAVKGFPFPEGFGLNIPDVPRVIQGMKSPMLGVEAEPVDGQLAQYFGVKEGVLVRSVAGGSSAEKAGIKAGDVILRVDDSKVIAPGDITSRLRASSGKTAQVAFMRDKKELTVTVTIELPSGPAGKAGRSQFLNPNE
jgi:serine protease Do